MNEPIFTDRLNVERDTDSLQTRRFTAWQVIGRIVRDHLLPRKKLVAFSFGSMLLVALTTGIMPLLVQRMGDDVFVARDQYMLFALPLVIIVVTALRSGAEYYARVSEAYIGHRIVADLRIQMFDKLANADLVWLQKTHSGRFISSFLTDATVIRETASRLLVSIGQNVVKVVALTGAMFWMDWMLASLAVVFLPIGIHLLARQRKRMRKATTQTLQETGDLGSLIGQTLTGIRVVKAYQQESRETERATLSINRAMEFIMRSSRARAISGPISETVSGFSFAAAMFYAGYRGIHGGLTIGEFMGFTAAAMLMYQPLKALAGLQTSMQEGVAASVRVFGIIDHDMHVHEMPDARPLKAGDGEIVFDNVTFAYAEGKPILRDFSLRVPAGKTVALVGPSGAGKSTVLNLLLRFYDPQKGRIEIDGTDIKVVTLASLRQTTALVTQDPFLFDDSVRANIAYGREEASQEEIEAAARAAAAHDFIARLPRGYDTRVGEAGGRLSGGERQRVAFARAMVKNAPILLLDEPTSSLDSEAEAQVQRALETLRKGRTVLMIAHRLSTVKNADTICVMDHGRIVETGTHDELLARSGLYSDFYSTQIEPALTSKADTPRRQVKRGRPAPAADTGPERL